MKILVTAASRYGATSEIARAIADVLTDRGSDVDVMTPEEVTDVGAYDAVVLGSAVYAGHWLRPARDLAERSAAALASRPVWLFSSGPVGDPPKPEGDPVDVANIRETTKARDHRVLPGKLAKDQLRFRDKAIVIALHVADGDFRDWTSVKDWASQIADALALEA